MRAPVRRLPEPEDAVELSNEAQCVSPLDLDETVLQHLQRCDVYLLRVQGAIDSVVSTSDSNGSERGANALSRDLNSCWKSYRRSLLVKERRQLQNLMSTSKHHRRNDTVRQKALDYPKGHSSIAEARRPQHRDRYYPDRLLVVLGGKSVAGRDRGHCLIHAASKEHPTERSITTSA